MTLLMQYAAETPPDPLWLRTLATVLPVVATIVTAVIATPKVIERLRERRREREEHAPQPEGPGVPPVVAVAAAERAGTDPIIRLFIEDLHQRLNLAHSEAAELHTLRATDAATIARLTTEISDREARLAECERELATTSTSERAVRRRLEQIRIELADTRRELAAMKGRYS